MVDDVRLNLETYGKALARRGYEVATATSAELARTEIAAQVPDIILLDIFMPKVSGFDLLRELRDDPKTGTVPVILISALADTQHVVEGLDRGANDYVTKPIVVPILIARIEALLRASALVRQLEVQTELLSKLAAFDDLTGVYNRRSLFHALETELSRSHRYGRTLSLMMLDLDHFKAVNDRHGHGAGDTVLRQVAQAVQSVVRTMDVVCRYGGEEFCVILPETNPAGAARAAERVRAAVEKNPIQTSVAELAVTVSIGVATWVPDGTEQLPDLLAEADRALLEAKRLGRNRVRVHDRSAAGSRQPS
jgi:two-component system, cell cycle response regulator